MLFNKNNTTGGKELRDLLGFIDASTNFDRWITWVELSIRQIQAVTGKALVKLADDHYNSTNYKRLMPAEVPEGGEAPSPSYEVLDKLVQKMQLTNALFAYVKLLPSLDAGHSNSGRKRDVGDKERGLSAVEAYKDEANILNLAYEALDALIEFAEEEKLTAWLTSDNRKLTATLLVSDLPTFDRYYRISSSRMFYTLVPFIADMQRTQIVPSVSQAVVNEIFEAMAVTGTKTDRQTALIAMNENTIRPALVFYSLATAVQRLPLDIFPDGIMQTQIVGTVKEKLATSDETRQRLIQSFNASGDSYMKSLQDQLAILNATATEAYVSVPKSVGNGFRF